jgi:hypothetical protein
MHPATILLYQSATAKPEVMKDWQMMLKRVEFRRVAVRRIVSPAVTDSETAKNSVRTERAVRGQAIEPSLCVLGLLLE